MSHVARTGNRRGTYRVMVGRRYKRDHLEDLSEDGRMIVKWVLKPWKGRKLRGLDCSGSE